MSTGFYAKKSVDLERGGVYTLYLLTVHEENYPLYFTRERIYNFVYTLAETTTYNVIVCLTMLTLIFVGSLPQTAISCSSDKYGSWIAKFILLDIPYMVHVLLLVLNDSHRRRHGESIPYLQPGYFFDVFLCFNELWNFLSICALPFKLTRITEHCISLVLYIARLHRPISYLWHLNDTYLKGSIIGTLLKFLYYAFTMRVLFATVLILIGQVSYSFDQAIYYWHALYATNKLFIPIGPDSHPINDLARVWYMTVMLSGCLVVMGIAVASLSLIIGLYMRPEETFRRRFQLIIKEMVVTNIPKPLLEKVETFYRMFWNKQKAVAKTQLLPTYPPCLVSDVNSNIYFRAQLTSRLLYNLSNHFLDEVAKCMETIHYIPGELIIKRNTKRSSLVFITYGDVEILSAEDDETPLLRLTRGSIKNPCGICPEIACTRSHVAVRAATFCTAHVLKATDFWRVSAKFGHRYLQSQHVHSALQQHLKRVKAHYAATPHKEFKYKSNLIQLKRSLVDLKEAVDADGNPYLKRSNYVLKLAGCYIMRNQRNRLRMEADPICLQNTFPCILRPKSSLLIVWNSFIAILTLIVAIIHPYNLIYVKTLSEEFKMFDYVVLFIYIVDIVVHLSTGTKVEEGVSLTLTETAEYQMDSHWFKIHLLSVLPVFGFIGDGHLAGLNRLCKVPVIFRMLKALEDECVYHSNVIRFFSYFVLVTIWTYFMAALKQGFLCFSLNYCLVKNLTGEPHWSRGNLDDETIDNRLTFSIYWAISMLTFTSHRTAQLSKDSFWFKLFVFCVLEVCLIIHFIIESFYSATIMVSETMRERYQTCINSVTRFFEHNDVDPVLRNRFIKYLQLCWLTDKAYGITNANKSIFFDLPKHVHQDILTLQRSKYVLSIQFTKYLSNELLKRIASQTRLFYVSPNEILLHTGNLTNEIYIIKQGVCEVLDPQTQKRKALLETKACFGDLECLLRIPAYYTVRAVSHVRIYTISIRHLSEAIALPRIKDAINFVKQLPEYEALTIRREPFVKYIDPPPAPNRQFFPLPRKFQSDYGFLNPFQKLRFFSILRYVFPRFTIRPDGLYLKRYEWFRATCAVAAALIFPVYTYFHMQWPWLFYVAWMLDIAAYIDMVQRLLVGYFNEDGILVYHPAATAIHYLKGAFLVDFFSCMPLEHLDSVRTNIYFKDDAYMQPNTIQLFMYNRIIQFYRVPGALKILDDYIERKDIILMIKAFPLIISLLTVVTSQMLDWTVEKWAPIGGGWRFVLRSGNNSWIIRNCQFVRYNITETPFNLVLTTFYWAVYETTSTGFNIFQAGSTSLMTVIVIGMLLGLIIITYYSVRVISIRSFVNQELASFQENMKDVLVFMKKEKLDPHLRRKVISYYEYMWKRTGGTTNRSVLKLCDQITLRTDTLLHIYGTTFNKCPILHKYDLSLLRAIGRALNTVCLPQGMTIIERGDVISNMYIVDYGTVEVMDPKSEGEYITKLRRGSVFGNLEDVSSVLSTNKFIASANTQLLMMSAELFFHILQDYPSSKAVMKKLSSHEGYIKSAIHSFSLILENEIRIPTFTEKLVTLLLQKQEFMQIYLILVSLICIYGDVYNASFEGNKFILIYMLYLLDVLFLVKFARQTFLRYFCKEPLPSQDASYFKTEFWFDLLSILPIELFSFINQDTKDYFALLRLNRFIRITTVYKCLTDYQEHVYVDLTIITITTVFIWFSLFIHCSTCLWHLIAIIEEKVEPQSSWQYDDAGSSLCDNEYLCSLYFILTTFTQNGVGDILPRQKAEVAFVCILMILSTIIFMIYVGEFSNIIQYRAFRYYSFYAKYIELLAFLKNNRVSKNMVERVKKYTLHLFRESRGNQVPLFLEKAPQCLRLHIMSAAYMHHLTAHPVFMKCEPGFLRQLVGHFELFIYCEDMHVVKEDQITNSMYFVHKGHVIKEHNDSEVKRKLIGSGEHFGTVHGLTRDLPYEITYKTVTKSKVLTLTYDKWEYLLKHFPKSKNIIYDTDSNGTSAFGTPATARSLASVASDSRELYSHVNSEGKKSITSVKFQTSPVTIKNQDDEALNVSDRSLAEIPERNTNEKLTQEIVQGQQNSAATTNITEYEQSTLSDSDKKYEVAKTQSSLSFNDLQTSNETKKVLLDITDKNLDDDISGHNPALSLKVISIDEKAKSRQADDKDSDQLIPQIFSDTTLKPQSSNTTIQQFPLSDKEISLAGIKFSNDYIHVSEHAITNPSVKVEEPSSTLSPLESKNLPPAEGMRIIELPISYTNNENDSNRHDLDFISQKEKKGNEETVTLFISDALDKPIESNTSQNKKQSLQQITVTSSFEADLGPTNNILSLASVRNLNVDTQVSNLENNITPMKLDKPSTSKSPLESEDLPPMKGMEIKELLPPFKDNENDNNLHELAILSTEEKKENETPVIPDAPNTPIELDKNNLQTNKKK